MLPSRSSQPWIETLLLFGCGQTYQLYVVWRDLAETAVKGISQKKKKNYTQKLLSELI